MAAESSSETPNSQRTSKRASWACLNSSGEGAGAGVVGGAASRGLYLWRRWRVRIWWSLEREKEELGKREEDENDEEEVKGVVRFVGKGKNLEDMVEDDDVIATSIHRTTLSKLSLSLSKNSGGGLCPKTLKNFKTLI